MPQPESCFSACRISGLSAPSSSWRSVTGAAATQPSTRHMRDRGTRRRESTPGGESRARRPLRGMDTPKRIWWARPGKLCALERPGGGGRSHRPERRAAEIDYLKANGVRMVVSLMPTRHNLAHYEDAGLESRHLPLASCDEAAGALD